MIGNIKKRIYTSLILFLLIYLIINFKFALIYSLIIFGILSIIEFLQMTNKIFVNRFYKYFFNLIFFTYILGFFCYFFILTNFPQLKFIIYMLLFGCIASDIGGFIFGKIFKGPKLTRISPKKTYSGAVGSLFLTCLVVSIIFFIFTNNFNFLILFLSIMVSLGCQVGDLFFSFLKRTAKIKDSGNFLPGHGGVLDRIDGMLIGIPLGLITIILIY